MYFYTYILRSSVKRTLYKGHTESIADRLTQHNSGKTKSIKHGIPWMLVYYERFNTRAEAIKREKYFKTAAGRRFIKNILPDNPVEVPMPEGAFG